MRFEKAAFAVVLGLAVSSCTIAGRAVIRNATAADLILWPLSEFPSKLGRGEVTRPIVYTAHQRQQAMIQRGNCLYTYPAPEYFQLPKEVKAYASRVVVVIHEDMTLHVHERSKQGVEGAEIRIAGFPLQPEAFCGERRS